MANFLCILSSFRRNSIFLAAPQMDSSDKGVTVGASVTLTALLHLLKHEIKTRPAYQTSGFLAIVEQLRL